MNAVYISGPISGHDLDERKKAFADAAEKLEAAGYNPVNPFDNNLPDDAPYEKHMREDLLTLLCCNAIAMLDGWRNSNGAKLEYAVAQAIGLKRIFLSNLK